MNNSMKFPVHTGSIRLFCDLTDDHTIVNEDVWRFLMPGYLHRDISDLRATY
jgi:hypothetical protein